MRYSFITLILAFLAFPFPAVSQDSLTNELRFEVNKILPAVSLSTEKLTEAHTLIDLNPYYKSSWVKDYISVEVLASKMGKISSAKSNNDTLSQEQKDIMNSADPGTDISVKVRYLPENNLSHNDVKEMDFTFIVDPASDARFPGGDQQLRLYLKKKAIDKIPDGSFKGYDFTAVKFTVSEEGEIIDAHIFAKEYPTSVDKKIQELLLEVIREMPCWKPAEYANGTKVNQEFALTVGNMENCVIHLLNIHRKIVE